MKIWLSSLLLFTLTATTAMAWPRVGDDAHYLMSTTGGPVPMSGTAELTVTGIDASQNLIRIRMTAYIAGYTESKEAIDKLSDAKNLAKLVPELVAHCDAHNGTSVQLATPAGVFSTCKISSDQGDKVVTTWYANVVFGYAKQTVLTRTAGITQAMILQSFTNGTNSGLPHKSSCDRDGGLKLK